MARAIWKGVIRFGGTELPVKLYSAVQDRAVHFRLLHAPDNVPVQQRMINPVTGEVVPSERIRRGFEAEPGTFVLLDDDELKALEPEPSRDINITRFVEPAAINHQWYDRPYYLGPDGDTATYAAVAKALGKRNVEGVARWTMRNKSYLGALRPRGEHLILYTLRYAEEVVPLDTLELPAGRDLDKREITMAKQLVSALEGEFDPGAYRDEYQHRVRELIEAKASGKKIKLPKPEKRKPAAASLADVLQQSLTAAKKARAVA